MNAKQTLTPFEKWKAYIRNYKTLMISIFVFILLDLSILIFNFYISYKIANNASVINVAAELEVLSQKISKNLLVFERAYNKSIPYYDILAEIDTNINDFERALMVFDQGGVLQIEDSHFLEVEAVNEPIGREAIEKVKPMWLIYKNYTNSVLEEFNSSEQVEESLITIFSREYLIKSVVSYTARNSTDLLVMLESLTDSLEYSATQKTRQLRVIQLFGIFLAVINFFYILFYSLKKIQSKDQALLDAKAEIEVMLNNIEEGVVLVDENLIIREHHSTEMEKIFNRADFFGVSLIDVLIEAGCDEDLTVLENYLRQWFDLSKETAWLNKNNPIAFLQIYNKRDSLFNAGKKSLVTHFSRVHYEMGGVGFLLVRFKDTAVADGYYQEIEYDAANQQKQLDIMALLIKSDVQQLPDFFNSGFEVLKKMQQSLVDDDNLVSICEKLLPLLQLLRQECNRINFKVLLECIEELDAILRSAMLNNTDPKIARENLSQFLAQLVSEFDYHYDIVNQLVGTQWPKKVENI